MTNLILPPVLSYNVGDEKQDFAVKAKYSSLHKNSKFFLIFGIFWSLIVNFIAYSFYKPLLTGDDIHFKVNNVDRVANINNPEPMFLEIIIFGTFILIGFGMLVYGLYSFFRKGGYFVGTPTRLIIFETNGLRSINWTEFSGNTSVSGNNKYGNLSLQLKSGQMVSTENGSSRFEAYVINMNGITNPYQIENMCRKRMDESEKL